MKVGEFWWWSLIVVKPKMWKLIVDEDGRIEYLCMVGLFSYINNNLTGDATSAKLFVLFGRG